jgi:hypothetical protein
MRASGWSHVERCDGLHLISLFFLFCASRTTLQAVNYNFKIFNFYYARLLQIRNVTVGAKTPTLLHVTPVFQHFLKRKHWPVIKLLCCK